MSGVAVFPVMAKKPRKGDLVVMEPQHPLCDEFTGLLEGPEGCDFKEDRGRFTWSCDSTDRSCPKAQAILRKYYPQVDIAASLEFFHTHGGYCDCEILFNVDRER